MVSPDSDQRFHPNPELLIPIEGNFSGKDILSLDQFDQVSLEKLFMVTEKMQASLKNREIPPLLNGIQVALIFADSAISIRTRMSFGAAVAYLGGNKYNQDNFRLVEDPLFEKNVLDYKAKIGDGGLIVMRHSQEGAVIYAAGILRSVPTNVPIVNAGDGIGEHPTQAMVDLYTMKKRFGRLDGLKGVIAGDLRNGRTLHSLVRGLSCYEGNTVYLLSPQKLRLREEERSVFASLPINLVEIEDQEQIPRDANFWYWTRVQKERFGNPEEYEAIKDGMVLTGDLLKMRGNRNMIIMHPGPVIHEVERSKIDLDPRWIYFEQAANGLPVRMALLALVLGKNGLEPSLV